MGKEYSNTLRKRGMNALGISGRSTANTVQATLAHWLLNFSLAYSPLFFSLFYYDTLKHDGTVIRPTILYTFIDLMYALLSSFTILTHDQRDEDNTEVTHLLREDNRSVEWIIKVRKCLQICFKCWILEPI